MLTEKDLHFFREGTHFRAYDNLGAHPIAADSALESGNAGTRFAVWAPNAASVSVVGDFNGWRKDAIPCGRAQDGSGIWELAVPEARVGARYKYHIVSRLNGYRVDKADPYAFQSEMPPGTASVVVRLSYEWSDARLDAAAAARQCARGALVHL